MKTSTQEELLKEVIRLTMSDTQNEIPPQSKMRRRMTFIIKESADGLTQKQLSLSEDYIVNVLGVSRTTLTESIDDTRFQMMVLREHLLFEGWWSDAVDWVKEKLEDNPVSSAIEAFNELGDGIEGVTAALTGIVTSGGNVIDTVVSGAKGLLSKGLQSVNKTVSQIAKRIEELVTKLRSPKTLNFAKKMLDNVKRLVELVTGKIQSATSAAGWKGMLAVLGVFLAVRAIRPKVESLGTKILEVLSGNWKKMVAAASSLYKEFTGDEDELDDVPETGNEEEDAITKAINYVVGAVKGLFWGVIKKVLGQAGVEAIAALAGPVGWIKKLADILETAAGVAAGTAWVCDGITDAINRATFKPLGPNTPTAVA